jgi:hypothetical protein
MKGEVTDLDMANDALQESRRLDLGNYIFPRSGSAPSLSLRLPETDPWTVGLPPLVVLPL